MNGKIKFHKATGPAFAPGEIWYDSSGTRVQIVSVRKYASETNHISDYGVTYKTNPEVHGITHEKDAWNFQVRYTHEADMEIKNAK